MTPLRALAVFATGEETATLSYQNGWPQQFVRHDAFETTLLNVLDRRWYSRFAQAQAVKRWRGDVIVLLHSVFSNACTLTPSVFEAIRRRPEPKVFFIGNEYKFMPEKMAFCDAVGLSMLVTQTTDPGVHDLYRRRLGCAVASLPNTGLDSAVFRPTCPREQRPIDIGYRAADAPLYIGHRERREIAEYFIAHAERLGVTIDVSLNAQDRFAAGGWAAFLNRCKAQLGTEAGGDFFELTDETRHAVNAYLAEQPDASWPDVRRRFFEGRRVTVPIRVMSSRNIEAAGTQTLQILFEGRYDGYLQPDVHYIPLKKDFSNVDEAIAKFRDREYADRIVDNAYRLVTEEFTYERLLTRFRGDLASVM